tara:strand:- start:982 stop:1578 length:597 start_codon:yes stop_codon:yes gene_type:complete
MTKRFKMFLVVVACAIIGFNFNATPMSLEPVTVPLFSIIKKDYVPVKDNIIIKKSFVEFLDKLAFRESSGNWKVINRFGFMGKYQLGKLALKDIGMDSITAEKFREDSSHFPVELQEIAIRKYIKKNKRYLRDCIKSYKNTTVNGILITESSIIGAAHLVGQRSVKEWLNCGGLVRKVDGNGTTIESYLKLFSGYQIV